MLNQMFPRMFLGELYMVFAPTSTGKSTFLMATAKEYAKHKKTMFLTTEESLLDLLPYISQNDNLFITSNYDTAVQEIKENDIHYLFYDYMGSTGDFSWNALKDEADKLTQLGITLDVLIFTAGQADDSIYKAIEDDNDFSKYTAQYVSFSKHIVDKCAGAFYLVKNKKTNILYSYPLKYRHGSLAYKPTPVNNLDFYERSWNIFNFGE